MSPKNTEKEEQQHQVQTRSRQNNIKDFFDSPLYLQCPLWDLDWQVVQIPPTILDHSKGPVGVLRQAFTLHQTAMINPTTCRVWSSATIAANVLENKSKELLTFLLASAQDSSVLLASEGQFRIGMHTISTTSTTCSVIVIVCVSSDCIVFTLICWMIGVPTTCLKLQCPLRERRSSLSAPPDLGQSRLKSTLSWGNSQLIQLAM